jgi:hypothetical protein
MFLGVGRDQRDVARLRKEGIWYVLLSNPGTTTDGRIWSSDAHRSMIPATGSATN